ncbi:MAG: hypothetical protein KGM15_10995 [Pseudomonadota bacterium]|nr:hypothetical protein [Pseudomonadota bacterium]
MTMTATIECFDPRADDARRRVELTGDRIVIARRVGGVEMRVALTPRQFRGVALAVLIAEETDFLYSVQLVHADPELSVTLASCGDEAEARAHWRRWAESLGLPCLIERLPGEYESERADAAPFVRRRGRATLNRRNRFLARRKMGRADLAALALNG